MIDSTGHACLADFGLLTITSDATDVTSSNSFREGGTWRWMSPELLYPKEFGSRDSRPTKSSDCYALGMVVYEVLREKVPFYRDINPSVVVKVYKGERPKRPQGVKGTWFGDNIWNLLQCCWKPSPDDRPRIEDVLDRLEEASKSWTPPPPQIIDPHSTTWDQESSTEGSVDGREAVSSQRSQRCRLEGNPTKIISVLPFTTVQLRLKTPLTIAPEEQSLKISADPGNLSASWRG